MDSSVLIKYFRRGVARGLNAEFLQFTSYGLVLKSDLTIYQKGIFIGLYLVYMLL